MKRRINDILLKIFYLHEKMLMHTLLLLKNELCTGVLEATQSEKFRASS